MCGKTGNLFLFIGHMKRLMWPKPTPKQTSTCRRHLLAGRQAENRHMQSRAWGRRASRTQVVSFREFGSSFFSTLWGWSLPPPCSRGGDLVLGRGLPQPTGRANLVSERLLDSHPSPLKCPVPRSYLRHSKSHLFFLLATDVPPHPGSSLQLS